MSQVLTVSNTGDSQEVDISQSSNAQNIGVSQNENTQSITVSEQDKVQTIAVTQADDIQSFAVTQQEKSQNLSVSNDVKFMKGDPGDKGDPGFSPTVDIVETDGGHNLIITDVEGEKIIFVSNGKTPETTDAVTEGDWRPVTSNAVYVEMSNITALMKTI